jgi:hypothetical protein
MAAVKDQFKEAAAATEGRLGREEVLQPLFPPHPRRATHQILRSGCPASLARACIDTQRAATPTLCRWKRCAPSKRSRRCRRRRCRKRWMHCRTRLSRSTMQVCSGLKAPASSQQPVEQPGTARCRRRLMQAPPYLTGLTRQRLTPAGASWSKMRRCARSSTRSMRTGPATSAQRRYCIFPLPLSVRPSVAARVG